MHFIQGFGIIQGFGVICKLWKNEIWKIQDREFSDEIDCQEIHWFVLDFVCKPFYESCLHFR